MTEKTCARIYTECLKEHEVEYVFGMAGGFGDQLLWAELANAGIKPILIRDERSAIWMAEGYAKTSGKPGVVCLGIQAVPHAINGLPDAYNQQIPVIVMTWIWDTITEKEKNESHGRCYFAPDLLKHVTKKFFYFQEPERLPEYINMAFRCATTGMPGPVAIMHPDPMYFTKVDVDFKQDPTYNRYPATRVGPDPDLVRKGADLLAKAERPVILTGNYAPWGGDFVCQYDAWDELRELAELLVAPVASNKGVLADTHPLNVGSPGLFSTGPFSRGFLANKMLCEADLVLMVCAKTGVYSTNYYTFPPMGKRIVQIDFDPEEIGRNYPVELGIVGDPKLTLRALINVIKENKMVKRTMEAHPRVEEIQNFMQEWRKKTYSDLNSDEAPIHPARVMKELNDFIDTETIIAAGGSHCTLIYGYNYLDTPAPGRQFLTLAGGYSQIGTGIPMALGVKLGAPDKRVILIDGDGSFNYNINELETAARYGIPIVMIVFSNLTLFFDRTVAWEVEADFPEEIFRNNYDFTDINFGKIAEAMGCYGVRVERPAEIKDAIKAALESNRPAVIDIRTKVMTRAEVANMYVE
jgi:acetolactate synthase-1/2/3 large subunit